MNIGIVGGGSVAIAHIRALQELESISNIFVYTRTPTRAEALAKEFSKVRPVESLKVLADNSMAIIIATPNNTHLAILRDIVTVKSIPVLCEKPLASSLDEAKTFLRLAHPLSVIGFNYRFNKVVLFIMELIRHRNFGDILEIDLAMNKNSAFTKKAIAWRDDPSQNGSSGAFGDLGCHLLDLVGYISGSHIDKDALNISKEIRVPTRGGIALTEDDHCVVTGVTENKVIFKLQASKAAEESELGFHINITLRNGEIQYSSQRPNKVSVKPYNHVGVEEINLNASQIIDDPKTEAAYWSDSFYLQDKLWAEQIMVGKLEKPLANIEVGVEIQELISVDTPKPNFINQ